MTNPFQGHFDGRGHTVTYSVKAGEKEHGLFPNLTGTEEQTAEVRDLKVVIEEYSPKKDAASGALVCRAEKSVISGVSVSINAFTLPAAYVGGGGVVGTVAADAVVENCSVKTAPGKYRAFGGIAYENAGRIENCEFVLSPGESSVGNYGGISRTSTGVIADCRSSLPESTVTAAPNFIGGIAAGASGEITGCTSVFQLTGVPDANANSIGGIVGEVGSGRISDCKVIGTTVLAWSNIGGIAGQAPTTAPLIIENCVSELGSIGSPAQRSNHHLGGILGGAEKFTGNITVRGCTASTDIYGGVNYGVIGGLVGYWRFGTVAADGPALTFTLEDCHSYARELNAATGQYVGGAIGYIGSPLDASGKFVSGVPTKTAVRNCAVSANVTLNASSGGGFIGQFDSVEIETGEPTFDNCRASGYVRATVNSGGFAGSIVKNAVVSFRNSTAEGNVSAINADGTANNNAGGFIGVNDGKTAVTGCAARGSVAGQNGVGGFTGVEQGPGSVYGAGGDGGCYAYGAVAGWGTYTGGFFGSLRCVPNATVTNCHAYGDVAGRVVCMGGFVGEQNGAAVKDCTASGNVSVLENRPDNWGIAGFVGNTADGNYVNSITGCKAFGNVDGGTYGQRVGGFAGEWGDTGGLGLLSNCESYGTVKGANVVGGFVGQLTSQTSVSNNASYCPVLTCPGANKGSFAGNIPDLNNHNLSNNKFTELPDCTPNGGAAELPASGGSALSPEEVKVSPKSVLAVTLAPAGNATTVTFAFTNAAGYSLVSFELSTDSGKTYTALVWDKVALVDLPTGALACANFTYTYAAPCTASTKVRVKLTNGTDTVTTEFAYT